MFGLVSLGACSTKVQNTGSYVPPTSMGLGTPPRPGTVYVADFALDPSMVTLDSGLRARLQRQPGTGMAEQQKLATDVQSAVSDTLVQAINRMGLHAVAQQGAAPRPGDVVIQGQVTKITAGNQTRRTLVGLGAGRSEITANVQVLYVQADNSQTVIQTYSGSSNSGRVPGLAVGGVAAAGGRVALATAGAVAGTISRARSGLGRDGENLAKEIATNLGTFFQGQGWLAQ